MPKANDIKERKTLFDACCLEPNMHVLDLGWEGVCLNVPASISGAQTTFVAEDVREVQAVEECEYLTPVLASNPAEVLSESVDAVLYRPAQRAAKGQVFEWIDEGFAALRVGGAFWLAGRKDRGVESYAKRLASVFGRAKLAGRSGRLRIYRAEKVSEVSETEHFDSRFSFIVEGVLGGPYQVETRAGVFSRDGFDPGTRLLSEHLKLNSGDHVLDWGCGWGALGMASARMVPDGQVTLLDTNIRAVECAQKNLHLNNITNARVEVCDARQFAQNEAYDLIVSNPPFHEGNEAAHPLIEGAYRNLKKGGRLILVVMRTEPYLKHMNHVFGHSDILAQKDGYSIISTSLGTP